MAAAVALVINFAGSHTTTGTSIGQSIAQVAGPRDTIVTTWGHADITRSSGLGSPYPYLWALPARTLDPELRTLDALLSGPRAPTWFVTWIDVNHWSNQGGGAAATARLLKAHYLPVARLGHHTIYLHRGVDRGVPLLGPPTTPRAASAASNPVLEPPPKELT